ncbi:peptidyl-prolyl cis-trans isomerase CYP26-2, chloroplastic [Physcomitrium patens]|uniref:PPIase cyclophilin-type domain-containing protein n=2 Tax=Physcomitrium patens TaxID=3218 RepID=A0A2K1J9Z3_PHYPA|nr:peptidyl-prolyl cis-trans isomerase CYP26-2, chloroplastic-like [Physcomitrium patens]PNR38344.1 hypothetical protein PHYPA_021455 [Physcomitrium patens]|eukprot:XP_024399270.1 peptidyl-prolyl cis-trans isomerase CYP26-2, chloroplastic-like [Physcomitrella patens]
MSSLVVIPYPTLRLRTSVHPRTYLINRMPSFSAGFHAQHTNLGLSRRLCCARASILFSDIGDSSEHEESCGMVDMGRYQCGDSDFDGVFRDGCKDCQTESTFSRRLVMHTPLVLLGFGGAQQGACVEQSSSSPSITKTVFMDVAIEGQPVGKILIGLYGDTVPIGAQRFAELAVGKRGIGYKRKEFSKIVKNYIQNVGVRSFSLTGGSEDAAKFTGGDTSDLLVDEMVRLEEQNRRPKHVRGSVSLVALDPTRPPPKSKLVARDGTLVMIEEQVRPPPNGTEFMITTGDAPELDQTNTVVGQVIQGMDVVDRIHNVKVVNENTSSPYFQVAKLIGDSRAVVAEKGFNRPYEKVLISKCGELR